MTGFQKIEKEIAEKYQPKKNDGIRTAKLFSYLKESDLLAPPPEIQEVLDKKKAELCSDGQAGGLSAYRASLIVKEFSADLEAPGWVNPSKVRPVSHLRRLFGCGTYLEFSHGKNGRALDFANFCHDRFCSCCNWRRSLKVYSQIKSVMANLEPEKYNYLFLTLTQKNCGAADLTELKQECDRLFAGWRWLYRNSPLFHKTRKRDRIVCGTIRSFEITYNGDNNTFHPHFHVILAVPRDYFDIYKDYYTTAAEWAEEWACALDLNYLPNVDVRRLRPDQSSDGVTYNKAVAEISKYATKITDVLRYNKKQGASILAALAYALRGRRLLALTGCFRDAFQALKEDDSEADDADLIHMDNDDLSAEKEEDIHYAVFGWEHRDNYEGYIQSEDKSGLLRISERLSRLIHNGVNYFGNYAPVRDEIRDKLKSKLDHVHRMLGLSPASPAVRRQTVAAVPLRL